MTAELIALGDAVPRAPRQDVERLAEEHTGCGLLGREEPPGERPSAPSTEQPPKMLAEKVARLDEENAVPAPGGTEHDLLRVGTQRRAPSLG